MNSTYDNFDSYISMQHANIQVILEKIRHTIHAAAPDAEEVISYQMPAFKYHGILVYFAACKNHIGFYPTASGIANFKDELWEKLSEGGEKSRCGWLKDKFGLSWQIIPKAFGELMSSKDPIKSKKVMEAMLKMDKIVITDLQNAHDSI